LALGNFIGFVRSSRGTEYFSSFNSVDDAARSEIFIEATSEEVNEACELASKAFVTLSQSSDRSRAVFLRRIAELLQSQKDGLHSIYCAESGLSLDRFESELLRTVRQLWSFADHIELGAWRNASIDTPNPNQHPAKPDLRKMSIPLGPVVVFGASNFPLAYSTIGGDAAAALAVGCPVIVKAHPLHAATSDFVAALVVQAAKETGMPEGVFSHLHARSFRVGAELVTHPKIKAVGFTGSHTGGRALLDLANNRKEPIPVFAEMGSVNPVFILPELLEKNAEPWSEMLANSMISGLGQFCTNPGLIFLIESEVADEFVTLLEQKFLGKTTSSMLHSSIKSRYDQGKIQMKNLGVDLKQSNNSSSECLVRQAIGIVHAEKFIQNPELQEEVFGPFSMLIFCKDIEELEACAKVLNGQLTATFLGSKLEFAEQSTLVYLMQQKVGRIVFNGVPTGVDISPSMHHGGPYPASSDSRFSAVGIDSIQRFIRPVTFQDFPDDLLPEPLKNKNLLSILRRVNAVWTTDAINF
jgi:alpha-ketoglutaric semialdehyde dehydrogenase